MGRGGGGHLHLMLVQLFHQPANRLLSRAEKTIGERSKLSMAWRRKKGGEACRL